MAVITAGTQPKVICGLTGHQKTLRDAVASVEPTDGPTQASEAATLAERLLSGHENAKVVVMSDGCFAGADELAQRPNVVWQPFGTEAANVAVTRFQVRRSLLDPVGLQVFIEVRNLSKEPVKTRLELTLEDELLDVVPLSLAAEQTWTKVFDQTTPDGGTLRARIDHVDALAADNTAVAILPKRRRIPVVLVGEGNLFLERVFAANQLVDLRVATTAPSRVEEGTILVFHRRTPETVPPGNVLFVEPTGGCDLWESGDVLDQPIVADQNAEHALMAHVRLDNVIMPQARKLTPTGEADVLVTSAAENPLYFAIPRPGGSALVLTVDLEQGDLPLRTAFPIMMTNALNWFTGDKGELQEAAAAGSVARVDVSAILRDSLPEDEPRSETASSDSPAAEPAAAGEASRVQQATRERSELLVSDPNGEETRVAAIDGEALLGPLDRCGVWTVTTGDRSTTSSPPGVENGDDSPEVLVACNLSNPDESDVRVPQIETKGAETLTAGLGGKPIWFYLIVVAWVLVATEWYLYQRRWIT